MKKLNVILKLKLAILNE